MGMISYAQNAEDVRLARAFPPGDAGFYLDVGAGHPVEHSVTKHFYDRVWRGINVEPGAEAYRALCAERTRDVNLNVGLSDAAGELSFYEAPGSLGRSTFLERWAAGWTELDGCAFERRAVPVTTLAEICRDHVRGEIDLLKIDAEGFEGRVLAGADWGRWRPRVLLIEAAGYEKWEGDLLAIGYLSAVFDGVNRFYVRSEDRDLAPVLAEPVRLFDDYVPLEVRRMDDEVRSARARVRMLEAELEACHADRRALHASIDGLRRMIYDLRVTCDGLRDDRVRCDEAAGRIAELEGRLAPYESIGPRALRLAGAVRRLAARHPRVAAWARRAIPTAG